MNNTIFSVRRQSSGWVSCKYAHDLLFCQPSVSQVQRIIAFNFSVSLPRALIEWLFELSHVPNLAMIDAISVYSVFLASRQPGRMTDRVSKAVEHSTAHLTYAHLLAVQRMSRC